MKRLISSSLCLIATCGLMACASGKSSAPAGTGPHAQRPAAGRSWFMGREPVKGLQAIYVNGFHYSAADPEHQVEANHYCRMVNMNLHECVIYDKYGRLIGMEHIISRKAFEALPPGEQVLWHAHNYEVKSGLLIAPGMSAKAERALMEKLVSTYGKTWHIHAKRPTGRAALPPPAGEVRLMKGFTADGQIRPGLVRERDQRFRVSSARIRTSRANIPDPGFNPIVLRIGPPPADDQARPLVNQ